jgi:hypothetical protein
MNRAIEMVQEEFDFYLALQERLDYADNYNKPVIKSMIKASTKRLRKMDDILFDNATSITQAHEVIARVFPVGMLPHEHPRRKQFNN